MNEYDYTPPTPGTIGKLNGLPAPWIMNWPKHSTTTSYVIVISTGKGTAWEVPYVRLYSVLNSKMILLPYGDYTNLVDIL